MKISAIPGKTYQNLNNNSLITSNRVSFCAGEDYGNDEFLAANDYVHKDGGSLGGYFKSLGEFVCALVRENVRDFESPNSRYDDIINEITEPDGNTYEFVDDDII